MEVLIVGAGPTGLMMACQLAMRNIPFRIIDKNEDHTRQSRALVVHARSLEIFEQMGIAENAINLGKKAKAVNLFINGVSRLRFDLTNTGEGLTAFPYLLILEQSKTEKILNDFLESHGYKVERNTELINLSQSPHYATVTTKSNSGKVEVIRAKWVIGADGANSVVRRMLGIPFSGRTYKQSLFVLDCRIDFELPVDEMSLSFSDETFTGLFPMTNGRCRVLGLVPEAHQGKDTIRFEDVAEGFRQRTKLNIELHDPEWISVYHAHHRAVKNFRKDRCFLAGDAAHIHSPVGAQGMNTGLQDAYNLAWKLSLVVNGRASEKLLDTYHDERIGIAQNLVRTTDRAFHFVTSQKYLAKIFRLQIMPLAIQIGLPVFHRWRFIRNKAFVTVSEIGLHYRNSTLSRDDPESSFSGEAPKPGERVPYVPGLKLSATKFHLIIFYGNPFHDDIIRHRLIEKFNDEIEISEISNSSETMACFKKFGIMGKGYYLIRPDGYIAYRGSTLRLQKIIDYLDHL